MNRTSSDVNLHAAFNRIDADGSGCISRDELRCHLAEKKAAIKAKDFDRLFAAIDTDRSGSINFDEYSRFMKATGGEKQRSSMKFATLEESLASINQPKKKQQREQEQGPISRSSSLLSMRNQKSICRGSMQSLRSSMNSVKSSINLFELDDNLLDSLHQSTERLHSTIRFFDVEVREYNVTASDNPCVRAGAAIELSWDYNTLERLHLDTFEEKRSTERVKDINKEKRLTRKEREQVLRDFGASPKEIQEAAKRATIVRNSRKRSIGTQNLDKKHEKMEKRIESVRKMFRRRSSIEDKEEDVDMERLHPTLMVMMGVEDDQ